MSEIAIYCPPIHVGIGAAPQTGMSEEARWLDTDSLLGSRTEATSAASRRLRDLTIAVGDASTDNWDGYGAARVAAGAVAFAERVLLVIPESWPSPDVGVDPDGDVSLEWSEAPDRVLTISIDEEGVLHYAGLFGDSKSYGAESFLGQLPPAIVGNLERLYSVPSGPAASLTTD